MCSRILSLLLILALPLAAHGVECSYFYSAINHPDPLTAKQKLAIAARRLPKNSYKFLFRNTVNDYRAAWSEGSVAGRPYRILKRLMFAPRVRVGELSSREIDNFYRGAKGKNLSEIGKSARALGKEARQAEAEKKLQWLSAISEPAIDGALELSSKLKQKIGPKLGLSNKPLRANLSYPGVIAVNVATGFGTYAYISDKMEKRRQQKLEKVAAEKVAMGIIGAPYLEEWAELGFVDPEQSRNLLDWNARKINEWGGQLGSADPNRPLPPRFYQFRLEGLLMHQAEVSRFEDIALSALQKSQRKEGNESKKLKYFLIAKLAADPIFGKKSEAERQILSLAFDPPVFLGENGDFSALESLMKGDTTAYLDSRRDQSDIHWMLQLAKNPQLKPVRDLFPEGGEALPAVFAQISVAADRTSQAEPWFPKNQLPSLKRADYFETLFPPSSFLDAEGKEVALATEIDYLRNWRDHPFFHVEMKKWKESGRAFSASELDEMREKTNALQLVHELQKAAKEEGRPSSLGGFAPDPDAAEACFLSQNDSYLKKYLEKLTDRSKNKNFCRYLLTLNFWRMGDLAQRERSTHTIGIDRFAAELPKLEQKYLSHCEDQAYQQEFAKSAGKSFPELEKALGCKGAP